MSDAAPLWTGTVTEGRIVWDRPVDLALHIRRMEGRRVGATIGRLRTKRSEKQNRAYFGLVVAILAERFGYERDEMHEALKVAFLNVAHPEDPLPRVRSTSDLSTTEFEEYVARIRRWAAESHGIDIPEPNEVAPW